MSKAELIAQGIKGSPQQSVLSNHYSFHLQSARYVMQKNSSKNPQTDKTNIVVPLKMLSYHNILQDIR